MPPKWRVRLSRQAEKDFEDILEHTRELFGARQVDIYAATLRDALIALEAGPDILGSAARDEIEPGIRSLHVARKRRRGRHFLIYRAGPDQVVEIVRILHDAMDLARHLPKRTRSGDAD